MLHSFSNDELRSNSKKILESLELWLRRLIHDELTTKYGAKYFEYKNRDGSHLFSNRIINDTLGKLSTEPNRFNRFVDALFFEDVINIVVNRNLYDSLFKSALKSAYSNGCETARLFLMQLVPIRNKLSHANNISVREAEKVLCYSHDVIESIQRYYKEKGMEKEYNVPTIIKIEDSKGNTFDTSNKKYFETNCTLFVGERLSINATVDESFDESKFRVEWWFPKKNQTKEYKGNDSKLTIKIEDIHVNIYFKISFSLISTDKNWHKYGDHDDRVNLLYKIVPLE